jgi:Na+-driven multidrug efflux pump
MIILLFILSKPISLLFSSNHTVLTAITTYLMIVPVSYGLYGVLMLSYNVLNVLHKPILACILALIYIFIFYVPLAYTGSYFFDLNGIFCGIASARILCGIAIYFILKKVLLSEENKSQPDILKRL